MATRKNDQLQGTLDLLVLKTLEQGPMHGWGITLHIERVSDADRMEQEGWSAATWGVSENNRRARFYRLTAGGRKQLAAEREKWKKITGAVALVLEFGKGTAS
jgi:PadR family transcriptional regulator PadR